jgi:hypothetical protein
MHIHTITIIITIFLLLLKYYYYIIIIIIIIIVFNPLSLQQVWEMLREGSCLYKWEVGETANHMGYVKIAILVFNFRTLNLI